jgi:hypothetical protein
MTRHSPHATGMAIDRRIAPSTMAGHDPPYQHARRES